MKRSDHELHLQGKYQITAINTEKFSDSFQNKDFVCNFTDTNIIQAYIGCNRIQGGYSLSSTKISIGPLMSTRMYCKNLAAQELALMNSLEKANELTIDSTELRLTSKSTTLILVRLKD
jgi:heat shock protein HslJ